MLDIPKNIWWGAYIDYDIIFQYSQKMSGKTFLIKIRGENPLHASTALLTKDSSVFQHLVHDLNQTELELEDFTPDIVKLFIKILADTTLETEIEKE